METFFQLTKGSIVIFKDLILAHDEEGNQINEASTYTIGWTWDEILKWVEYARTFCPDNVKVKISI